MTLRWTAYGAPAYDLLKQIVRDEKAADPLAPVTLIVPTNLCGTMARRVLAAGLGPGTPPGVAGLTVLTADRLAELLAAPRLTAKGRRPATGPLIAAAWRTELARQPGLFAQVADHQATVTALARAHQQLRELGPGELAAVAATSALSADLVRLHRAVLARMRKRWYDVTDLRAVACEVVRARDGRAVDAADSPPVAGLDAAGPAAAGPGVAGPDAAGLGVAVGVVVVFLPQELQPSQAALLAAVARHAPMHVITGLTGQARADAGVSRTVGLLTAMEATGAEARGTASGVGLPEVTTPIAQRVLHASDSDDEVRAVIRDVVAVLGSVPRSRVAIFYGSRVPYARLLHEHLDAAGITVNGPGVRPTAERVLPRALLDVLAMASQPAPDRAALFRLLAAAPVRDAAGHLVPTSRWERVSRLAGVTGGSSWQPRLVRYAADQRRRAEVEQAQEAPWESRVQRLRRDADAAEGLLDFLARWQAWMAQGRAATSWAALSAWALHVFRRLFGGEDQRRRLPEAERRAAERVEHMLAAMAGLDLVGAAAGLAALRDVVELELANDLPRVGTFGTGVLVAPLSAAPGLIADAVYVVGLAEGLCPGRHREDALLPDAARIAAGGALTPARDRLDRQHRDLLTCFAAAPQVTASFPRGDLRRSGERLPSRWLLPTLRALSRRPGLAATEWESVPDGVGLTDGDGHRSPPPPASAGWLVGSPSFAATVSSTAAPVSGQEWRLRALVSRQRGRSAIDLPGDEAFDRAVALMRARHSAMFTRFDGDLRAVSGTLPNPADGTRSTSPTTLERWVACPHGYFVRQLLGVEPVEQPDDLLTITPMDRGSLVHQVLDEFFAWLLGNGGAPAPDQEWTSAQRAALQAIGDRVAVGYEERGITGHPTMWARDRVTMLQDLDRFLDDDQRVRSTDRRRQVRSELRFGGGASPPVEIGLPGGRVVRLIGSADRVDRCADGSLVVVDYKSGSARTYRGLGEADPDLNGSRLQLPVYAYAAAQTFSSDPPPIVRAEYWFLGARDRGLRIGYEVTTAVDRRYAHVLASIIDGVAGGVFPHRAPEDQPWADWVACAFCDPDGLGGARRRAEWQRKKSDPALAAYLDLVEPAGPLGEVP